MRVGDYRVIYGVIDLQKTIIVYQVGHRREIYD
ncbi:MAG: type II toxin-antitoxin system RelE family toxin [Pseudanabaena sp.]